jgi:hypothetical protein
LDMKAFCVTTSIVWITGSCEEGGGTGCNYVTPPPLRRIGGGAKSYGRIEIEGFRL